MTLPDDIELAKELDDYLQNGEWGVSIFAGHRDILVKELMKFIATYRKKWEAEADRATIETIYALLNGDENQVVVAKSYIWNKLQALQGENK